MPHGLMVVNAFLHSAKFNELYQILLNSADECGMELSLRTNAELCTVVDTPAFDPDAISISSCSGTRTSLATQLGAAGAQGVQRGAEHPAQRRQGADLSGAEVRGAAHAAHHPRAQDLPGRRLPRNRLRGRGRAGAGAAVVLKECFGSFGIRCICFTMWRRCAKRCFRWRARRCFFRS